VSHPNVPLVSFTGGTVTAEKIRRAAAATSKKFSLEVKRSRCCLVGN
jgi:acyl-CoA reductase-like NAD-dependent aldehyde dehydrogenase